MRSALERYNKRNDDEKCAAAAKSSFELLEVQSKVRDAARKQIAKHVESKIEAEKWANQCIIDLGKEQLARQLAEAKAFRLEKQLEKCRNKAQEEESKNIVLDECLARERLRSATMRTEIRNEWQRSNELRDELYERFSDIEKLQGVVGDEADRRITAERNAVSLKRQLEEEIDYRKFIEKILAKEKYRADSLDIELHNILHDYGEFEKFMVSRGAKLFKEKRSSEQTKSCALVKRIAGKLATNANENQASEVSSEEAKSETKTVLQTDLHTESNGLVKKLEGAVVAQKDDKSNFESAIWIEEKQENAIEGRRNRAISLISSRVKQLVLLLRRYNETDFSESFCVKMERGALKLQAALTNQIKKQKKVHKQVESARKMLMKENNKNQFGRNSVAGKKTGGLVGSCGSKMEELRQAKHALELEKCMRRKAESKHKHEAAKSINLEILLQEEKTMSDNLKSLLETEVQLKVNWEKKFTSLSGEVDKLKDELTEKCCRINDLKIKVEHLKGLVECERAAKEEINVKYVDEQKRVAYLNCLIEKDEVKLRDLHYQQLESLRTTEKMLEKESEKRANAEATVSELIHKLAKEECLISDLEDYVIGLSRRSDEIRFQLEVEIEKKDTAENELINLQQEIKKITDELTSGEETESIIKLSGDIGKKDNYAENKRNLPELKHKQTETSDFPLEKQNSSLPELKDKQTETSENLLSEEQQKTSNLKLMLEEESAKRQKVEKRVLDLEAMIESDENTQMEIKVLKDLCQEEAQLRRDLQADALNKNLRIEQLKMKIKMLDAEKKDVLENVHVMGSCHEHGHFKEQTANHMEAVVMEEIEKRNQTEKKVKELEILLHAKQRKADDEMSKDLLQERITKKYFEGDYLDKKFKTMLAEEIRETEFAGKKANEMTLREQAKKDRNGAECGADNVDDLNAAGDGMEINCDGKRSTNVRELPLKEDKRTSTTDFCIKQEQQMENKLQQMLAEETEQRTKVEKNVLELEMTDVDDKLDIVTETKVLRDLYEKEAKLKKDLEADGLKQKLMIEELIMKTECLETEKKQAIESSNKSQNEYFLQTAGDDELLAMLAEEIEKRIEAEKKVDDLKKLLESMENKMAAPEQNTKLGRFKIFEILLKNELERGKNVKRNDGEVAMMLKLEDNASGYFKRNIGVKNCVEDNQETRPQKKDRATETSEDFGLLTEEIEKRKKAEKKVLELQMIMDDDEKIDTAMEIKVWRDACKEEAKLRRDLEADGLRKKLQIEQLKMKLKVFDAETADFKANMHKAGACIAHEHESANNVQALLAEEIKRSNKLENRVQELEMLLGTKEKKSNDEEAINVFKRVAEEDSVLNYFEDVLVQNEFWT